VERLVEATNAISFRDSRFRPTLTQRTTLLEAPQRALAGGLRSSSFRIEEARDRRRSRRSAADRARTTFAATQP
jgi:hypothetical protein